MIATTYRTAKARFRESTVARGASFTLVVRIYGAALAYFIQLYLARTMGAEQLGIFVFAWTCLSIVAFLTPLGFDTALVRFLASFTGQNEWGRAKGVIQLGYIATLTSAITVSTLGLGFIWLAGEMAEPYTLALTIAIICMPVIALMNLHEGIARGFNWVYQVSLPSFALRPTVFLTVLVSIALLGYPINSTLAISAMGGACVLTLCYQYWRYRRTLHDEIDRARGVLNVRYWLLTALPMVFVVSFEQLLANTDIVMLGILESPATTGIYNIAVRIAGIALFIFFAVSAFSAPRIAELYNQNRTEELVRFIRIVRLAIALPTIGGLLLLGTIGMPLLRMFGGEFTHAYYPMLILCIAVGARALAGPVDNILTMTGQQNKLAKVLGLVALLNLSANSILIPIYGSMGAAIATSVSIVTELSWVSILAGRHVGFRPWLLTPVA